MLGRPLSLGLSLQTTDMNYYDAEREINKIPKCFSCFGDCEELSKKTKRSTYDSNQAMADLTADNSPITKQIRTNETPKCFSNLGNCSRLSKEARRWNSRNQGSSQLTVWQWLTCTRRAQAFIILIFLTFLQ